MFFESAMVVDILNALGLAGDYEIFNTGDTDQILTFPPTVILSLVESPGYYPSSSPIQEPLNSIFKTSNKFISKDIMNVNRLPTPLWQKY